MSVGNENWKCSACGTENSSNFCSECGSVKPGYVPGNKQAQNVSDDTDGKWRCKVCGTTNTSVVQPIPTVSVRSADRPRAKMTSLLCLNSRSFLR